MRRRASHAPCARAAFDDAASIAVAPISERGARGMRVAGSARFMQNHASKRGWLAAAGTLVLSLSAACSAPRSETLGTGRAADTAFANDRYTYQYFRAKGFTNFQAAAIVGNLDQESGIDPNISQQN